MELGGHLDEDPCAGYLVDDSDLEYSDCSGESSGEEPVKSKESKREEERESEDEFEREMEAEAVLLVEEATGVSPPFDSVKPVSGDAGVSAACPASTAKDSAEYYDQIYFDSSSDDEPPSEAALPPDKKQSHKRKKLTNDELLYDPDMDDEDERWVQRQRMAYRNVRVSEELKKRSQKDCNTLPSHHTMSKPESAATTPSSGASSCIQPHSDIGAGKTPHPVLPNTAVSQSDAILSCPACMSTLCLDCQRHETYTNQYRAMFVLNCKIIMDEVLRYKPKKDRKSKKKRRQDEDPTMVEEQEASEVYHPVRCSVCNTEVAVYDIDEVFHFFSVLASAP